jgi:taurine dioxygenase
MTPSIQPKDATLGAVVTNIDLAHLNDATGSIVEDAFIAYGVLIFPGQHLDDDEQVAFMSRFGDLEIVLTCSGQVKTDSQLSTNALFS